MRAILCAVLILLPIDHVLAQRWQWPQHPKNLTVLPKTTTPKDLQKAMLSFTSGLGVRCVFCHVGEEGKGLEEFDFPSDKKPEKNTARTMIKMVDAINNQYLATVHSGNGPAIQVTCMTCHRGNALPILLEDELKLTFDRFGIDSTINQYHALRARYYGGFTYNFKEGTLVRLADKMLEDTTNAPSAIQVLRLNAQLYPEFPMTYARLAEIYEDKGDLQQAAENYQQALKLDPNDERLRRRLERLGGGK